MANEVNFGYATGKTLTFAVYESDGTEREAGSSLTETPASSGLYLGSPTTITTGDNVVIKESSDVVGSGAYHVETILASDGFDGISITEPSGIPANFREMIVQTWRRLFGKSILTKTELKCYKADGTTVATTQVVSADSASQTQGEAS